MSVEWVNQQNHTKCVFEPMKSSLTFTALISGSNRNISPRICYSDLRRQIPKQLLDQPAVSISKFRIDASEKSFTPPNAKDVINLLEARSCRRGRNLLLQRPAKERDEWICRSKCEWCECVKWRRGQTFVFQIGPGSGMWVVKGKGTKKKVGFRRIRDNTEWGLFSLIHSQQLMFYSSSF